MVRIWDVGFLSVSLSFQHLLILPVYAIRTFKLAKRCDAAATFSKEGITTRSKKARLY